MGTGKDLGKKVTSCLFAIAASLLLFGPASHAEEDIAGVVVDAHGDPVSLTDVFFCNRQEYHLLQKWVCECYRRPEAPNQ